MTEIERRPEPIPPVVADEWAGDSRMPWDRLDDEGKYEFSLFKAYLSLGRERSIRKLSGSTGIAIGKLSALSRNYSWLTRVQAWDDEQVRIALVALEGEGVQMRARHAQLAADMMAKAEEAIMGFDPRFIQGRDLPGWVETAAKLERMSRGVGDVKQIKIDGDIRVTDVAGELSTDQRRELLAAAAAELQRRAAGTALQEIVEGEIVEDGNQD